MKWIFLHSPHSVWSHLYQTQGTAVRCMANIIVTIWGFQLWRAEYSTCSWCQWWKSKPVRFHSLTWRLLMEISCVCSTATALYSVLPYHMLGFTMSDAQWYGAGGWGKRHDEDKSVASKLIKTRLTENYGRGFVCGHDSALIREAI